MAMAAVGSFRVAAVGVRGWAPKTQARYRSALSAVAKYEGTRALRTPLTDTLSDFLASRVSMGQARSTLRGYVSASRAAEDIRLLPSCVQAIHWRLAKSGKPTPGQPYLGPEGLSLLWARAASPVEQAVAALANLSWLLFLRVSEAVSITPAGLASDSVVLVVTTKVGGHREVRRPLYEWGRSWVRFLRSYAAASCVPEGQSLVRGGVEAVEKIFADLLRDSPYSDHRWHSMRRGGAAAAFHRSPNVAYFVWWGRWKRLATSLEYALGYSDPAVVGALVLPWPVGSQTPGERLAVLLADLWGDPMYANPERKSPKASLEIAAPVPAGLVVSLPGMDVAPHQGEMDDVESDSDSSSVPSESSASAVSTASACGSTAKPAPPADPGERPPSGPSKTTTKGGGRRHDTPRTGPSGTERGAGAAAPWTGSSEDKRRPNATDGHVGHGEPE